MKRVIAGLIALLAAFLVHTLLGRISASAAAGINVFLLTAILFGMVRGDLPGAVLGAAVGLTADAFSLGVFGLAGLTATACGFLAGWISRKINVATVGRGFVFIALLSAAGLAGWSFLVSMVFAGAVPWRGGALLLQPLLMAAFGSLVLYIRRRIVAAHER